LRGEYTRHRTLLKVMGMREEGIPAGAYHANIVDRRD
jgi:hypothetical protein